MDVFVALLRAVNVGGTGTMSMAELAAHGKEAGFGSLRTVGASGNVVFRDARPEAALRDALAARLRTATGRDVGVVVRSLAAVEDVLDRSPFAGEDGARVHVIFTDAALAADPLAGATGHADERVAAGRREVFVFYPAGAGRTRLALPSQRAGTARNINTLVRLAAAGRLLATGG